MQQTCIGGQLPYQAFLPEQTFCTRTGEPINMNREGEDMAEPSKNRLIIRVFLIILIAAGRIVPGILS